MAQVDFINYFSIIIWFNLIFLFFYLMNYMYMLPMIYNNLYMSNKILKTFINNSKLKFGKFFLLLSKNLDKIFNFYYFNKINLNVFNLYSNFVMYSMVLC